MKFTDSITKTTYDTNDYLESFVDEYTGEILPNRKVLNKRVRKLWFRSVYPAAIIKQQVTNTSALDKVAEKLADHITAEELMKLVNLDKSALAYIQIYVDGKFLAENYALRRVQVSEDGSSNFEYYTEAALNAALDRCLIDLGFVVPEEIEKAPKLGTGTDDFSDVAKTSEKKTASKAPKKAVNTVTEAQKAVADIEALVETEDAPQKVTPEQETNVDDTPFDKSTPVEEIMKHLTPANARAYVFTCNGKWKGKTVGEAYESDKDKNGFSKTLNWFAGHFVGKDNILVAACKIVNNQ